MQAASKPLIYLASASPRRSALLSQIGIAHTVRPVDLDESLSDGESPREYVRRLACAKAEALWQRLAPHEKLPVLGADTTVAIDGVILAKPGSLAEERSMLRLLGGRTHQVYTGIGVHSASGLIFDVSVSEVTFRALTDDEIEAYWATGEPADKAGGYAVQGRAAVFIERISGSYSGIVGLPLFETAQLLAQVGCPVLGHVQEAQARALGGAAR